MPGSMTEIRHENTVLLYKTSNTATVLKNRAGKTKTKTKIGYALFVSITASKSTRECWQQNIQVLPRDEM